MNPLKLALALALAVPALHAADIDVKDPRRLFEIIDPDAKLELLAENVGFGEAPVWVDQDGGHLLFTNMHKKIINQWDPRNGVSVFKDGVKINGMALADDGSLICCDTQNARLVKLKPDGAIETLADNYQGKKLNSPNDIVITSEGVAYFTDPWWMKKPRPNSVGKHNVWRYDLKTKELSVAADDNNLPNGIAISPDQKTLYVAQTAPGRNIKAYDIKDDGSLANPEILFTVKTNVPDGIKCDERGNIWATAGEGVEIRSPKGELLGVVKTDPRPVNLCFGGPDGKTVYITTKQHLYRIPSKVRDARAADKP